MYTSLHRELGWPAGKITPEMIDEAIELRVRETKDLDYKAFPPDIQSLGKSDVVKDIAAMANSGGGMIIFGVSEDGESNAAGREDLSGRIGHDFEQAVLRIAATKIAPPVFGLHLEEVGGESGPALAVVVPPSRQLPHILEDNKKFRVPVRTGPHTTWLTEPEIARLYRDRFGFERDAKQALDELYNRAYELRRDSDAWFVGVAKPHHESLRSTPSQTDIQKLALKAYLERGKFRNHGGVTPLSAAQRTCRRGLRSWQFSSLGEDRTDPALVALHDDGSIQVMMNITSLGDYVPVNHVSMPHLELCVIDLLFAASQLARSTGHGEYDMKIGVEWEGEKPRTFSYPSGYRAHFDEEAVPLPRFVPVETSLNVLEPEFDLVSNIWGIAEDCANQAGYIRPRHVPEPSDK